MKKILVTGANGQLGQAFYEIAPAYHDLHFIWVSKEELDITSKKDIETFFNPDSFHGVINCAAYTAVDKAEAEPELAYLVNAKATKYLAEKTAQLQIPFVHISTDYVFDGNIASPRLETDLVNPIGVYGKTKLQGEEFALEANPQTIIIRTSWVYSKYGNNFVKTMLKLFHEKEEINVINDQVGSPTNAVDLAHAIAQILSKDNYSYGIYNFSNEGRCSWFDFALKIKEISNASIKINPITSDSYPTLAKRPKYSLLDKTKIKNHYQLEIADWEESLEKELKIILKY